MIRQRLKLATARSTSRWRFLSLCPSGDASGHRRIGPRRSQRRHCQISPSSLSLLALRLCSLSWLFTQKPRTARPRTRGSMSPPHRLCELARANCMAAKSSPPPLTSSCRRSRGQDALGCIVIPALQFSRNGDPMSGSDGILAGVGFALGSLRRAHRHLRQGRRREYQFGLREPPMRTIVILWRWLRSSPAPGAGIASARYPIAPSRHFLVLWAARNRRLWVLLLPGAQDRQRGAGRRRSTS